MGTISLIKKRFTQIDSYDDFLTNDEGLMRLDSISMRLQAIGEAIKNISKRDEEILLRFANKEYWSNIIKTREILSHHYIDIDPEIVFEICNHELTKLKNLISKMIAHK